MGDGLADLPVIIGLSCLVVTIAMLLWQNHRIVKLTLMDQERRATFMSDSSSKDPVIAAVVKAVKEGKIDLSDVRYDANWETSFNRRERGPNGGTA
jgi:hypothetical protein